MYICVCVHAHLYLTLSHPMDGSPSGSMYMGFLRQKYWSGLPFPSPWDLPNPGIKPASPASPALAGGSLPLSHLMSYYRANVVIF